MEAATALVDEVRCEYVGVNRALDLVRSVAGGDSNLLYPMKEALLVGATLGEISDVLRDVFGVYRAVGGS